MNSPLSGGRRTKQADSFHIEAKESPLDVQPPNLTVGLRYSHPSLVLPSLSVSLLGFLLLQGECDEGQEMGIKDHTKSGGFGEGMVSLVLLAPEEGVLRVEGALKTHARSKEHPTGGSWGHGQNAWGDVKIFHSW